MNIFFSRHIVGMHAMEYSVASDMCISGEILFCVILVCPLLAHLSQRLTGELIG